MSQKAVAVKATVGLTVATMTSVVVSVIAASLALGLLAALPLLQAPRVRIAAIAGGGGEEAPRDFITCQGLDRINGGAFLDVLQNPDGSYQMAGWGRQPGRSDIDVYLVRGFAPSDGAGPEGCEEWAKFFGGSGHDSASSIALVVDGAGVADGHVLAAEITPEGGAAPEAALVKTTLQGNLDPAWPQNPKIFFHPENRQAFSEVIQTFGADGNPTGFLAVGRRQTYDAGKGIWNSQMLAVKTDTAGRLDPSWQVNPRLFPLGVSSVAHAVTPVAERRAAPRRHLAYVVAGETTARDGNIDLVVIKLNPDGSLASDWTPNPRTFDWSEQDIAKAVAQTFDGEGQATGFIIAGETATNVLDALVLKLAADGAPDPRWSTNPQRLGAEDLDRAEDVQPTYDPDGRETGYIVAGETHSLSFRPQGEADMYVVRLGPTGEKRWQLLPPGTGIDTASAVWPVLGSQFAYVVAGQTTSLTVGGGPDAITHLFGRGNGAPEIRFRRGDADGNGQVNLTDAIFTLNALFKGGPQWPCQDAGDADDNGVLNLTDAVFTLNYLFRGSGLPPPPPGPTNPDPDPTADILTCVSYQRQ